MSIIRIEVYKFTRDLEVSYIHYTGEDGLGEEDVKTYKAGQTIMVNDMDWMFLKEQIEIKDIINKGLLKFVELREIELDQNQIEIMPHIFETKEES